MTDDQRQQTDRDNLADLIHEAVNAGGDYLSFDVAYSIAGCFVGSEWLKEHVAAARREALLEARDYLAEQEQFGAAELVRTMLAERDEESSR